MADPNSHPSTPDLTYLTTNGFDKVFLMESSRLARNLTIHKAGGVFLFLNEEDKKKIGTNQPFLSLGSENVGIRDGCDIYDFLGKQLG